MLEKVDMKTRTLKITARRGDAGFTAIEIAMVAAVIAILSLIVLPIFRNRVEDAKIAAAQADLTALMKSEQVVKADIDAYARLEDLDNVQLFGYTGTPVNGLDKEVPYFKYIKPELPPSTPNDTRHLLQNVGERAQLAGTNANPVWRGPYIAFQRAIALEDLRNTGISQVGQYLCRSVGGDYRSAVQDFTTTPFGFGDSLKSRIPVDPWGNPYMFFPPTGNNADASGSNTEYASCVIYSLGPNGQPGDGTQGTNGTAYTREYAIANPNDPGALGQDDDLMVEF